MDELRGLWRGKRIDNGEWVYGVPLQHCDGDWQLISGKVGAMVIQTVVADTLGECTGLRDKNGKPIFEGDIVQTKHGRLCKIVWRSNSSVNCWDMVPLECKRRSPDEWDLWDSKNLLVVGNVSDNPELLNLTGEDNGNAAQGGLLPAT